MTKSGREIMEIFEAFDLTGTAWSAAQLAGLASPRRSRDRYATQPASRGVSTAIAGRLRRAPGARNGSQRV